MNKNDIVILDIGNIVIHRNNGMVNYYKEVEGELVELTENELKEVEEIFSGSNNTEYYSEKLELITKQNPSLENNYEYLMYFFDFLERVIPENYHNNFYRNLETLKLELNFDLINQELDGSTSKYFYTEAGRYNTRKNELIMDVSSHQELLKISQKTENPEQFFWLHTNATLLHELSHMASSYYDEKACLSYCGYDLYPAIEKHFSNRGLTEGMTEVIAMAGFPGTIEIASGYYIEALFINQLIQIVGKKVMAESYFGNEGTSKIEDELNKLIDEPEIASVLFRRIEDNFNLRDVKCQQTVLANIQSTLVTYFKKKIESSYENKDFSELENSVNIFEAMLVTPEKLEVMEKDPHNYIGLDESIKEFYKLKEDFLNNKSVFK
ncbi:MAG: hypothetical protein PHO63_01040 [Bacilli bacterium]|nr:hypothetical protein [Bacilli bacterium]MDD4808519.1 hypothetical protein [Bacilli bacterium]